MEPNADAPADFVPDNQDAHRPPAGVQEPDTAFVADAVSRATNAVREVIVGQTEMVDLLIAAVLARGHVLIEGVPGIAKTLTARLLARTMDARFSRIQFTPDLMPSDVLGTSVFDPRSSEFRFHDGPIFANLILIDEINRAPAKTQSALFEVMEERQVTVEGTTRRMEEPFMVFATQNPLEHEGTYRLPEAQLDRFLFKIEVGYPGLDDEVRILEAFQRRGHVAGIEDLQPVWSREDVLRAQQEVERVFVSPDLLRYAAGLVSATREHPALYLAASPRASLALVAGSRALAAMRGRSFVIPDDIVEIAAPVLRHRILLTPEREMEGYRPDDVVRRIVEAVEVPR